MDEKQIIALFFQRSEDAIAQAQAAYGPMCRNIALRLLGSEEDAQECLNDTWHSLWNAIPPERPKRLRAYIARITRNLAMKRLTGRNAQKRTAAMVSFEELSQCIPDEKTVEMALEGKELARAIDAFLDTLTERERNLFLRRYWFFDSIKELSRSFHMSESNVKVTLYRIRNGLKDYLAKEADIYVG